MLHALDEALPDTPWLAQGVAAAADKLPDVKTAMRFALTPLLAHHLSLEACCPQLTLSFDKCKALLSSGATIELRRTTHF